LEPADGRHFAVRLGLRMAKGLSETHAAKLIACRSVVAYRDVEDVWRRAGVPVSALERLAYADAFQGFGIARRNALWAIRGLDDTELPLMIAAGPPPRPALSHEPPVVLPPMPAGGEVVSDYRSVGLTLRQHPVSFVREELERLGVISCASLADLQPGRRITVAGIMLVRQRPGSAKGVMFATIEDETGHANIIVWPKVFERQRRIVLSAGMIACRGLLQRESDVTHIVAEELTDLSRLLASVGQRALPFPITHGRGDQVTHGGPDSHETLGRNPRDIYVPDIQIDALKVKTRDFR
jgi:error-prone DNA polymerase